MFTMHFSPHILRVFIAVVFAMTFNVAAQTIIICASCSWELAADAKFCSHCGAEVGGTRSPNAPTPATPVEQETPAILEKVAPPAATAITQDITWAKEFRTANNNSAALAALANARGIVSVSPSGIVSEDDRRFIFDGIEALRKSLTLTSPAPCPVCKGTGQMETALETRVLAGTTPMSTPKKKEPCKFCNGAGTIHRYQVAAIKAQVAAGEREYARVAQIDGRKLFPRSTVYMPEILSAAFTKDQTNLLARTSAAVCATCAGFGLEACAACDGMGVIKCPEKNCVNGLVKDPPATPSPASSSSRGTIRTQVIEVSPISKRCEVCNGVSFIRCPTCVGMSTLPCKRCATR
ncbi:MAG: hypothetical protein FWG05_02060 [Kiritimatiellaeota bacterium]|nr:hypothetical protein [Kiritimatiellota bacterium]